MQASSLDEVPGEATSFERQFITPIVEVILVSLVGLFSTLLTFALLSQSVDLYFPADAAHYVGDADALIGQGVRELRHPPLFPVMLVLVRPVLGDIGAFHASMGFALFLLPVALHFLLRQWFSPVPSLAGAAFGTLTPSVGELIGWSGGATLLALDCMVLAIASFELWTRRKGKEGLLVGLFLGLAALSHPFVLGAAAFVIAVRWAFFLFRIRSITSGWEPNGLRGAGSALGVAAGLLALSIDYYLRLKASGQGGPINLDLPREFLLWGVRENTLILFFLFVALLLPVPLKRPSLLVVLVSITVLFLAVPLIVSWDVSYSSRVVYLLPPLFGVGAASLVHLALAEIRDRPKLRKFEVLAIVGFLVLATAGSAIGFGYAGRVEFAVQYYQRIRADDLTAFAYLRGGQGTVATSWTGAFQDEGSVSAWFVEALSKRPALGPGAPWLSTLTTVGSAELDMQRAFSGTIGIENGALQASSTPAGGLRDPAVQVAVGGFYYPLFFVNTYSNVYPVAVDQNGTASLENGSVVQRQAALVETGELSIETRLQGSQAIVSFSLRNTTTPSGNWSVWIWPAYFRPWTDVTRASGAVVATQAYRDAVVTTEFRSGTTGASLMYYESDPTWGIQAIEIVAPDTPWLELEASVDGGDLPAILAVYTEDDLIARYGMTSVLLWKDTGWRARFDASPRFNPVFESTNTVVYAVV
jgi:hypothetical protein